jgi:transcriptional regulator with PAS, ATPase and Fis domain
LESELFGYEEGSFTGAKKGGKPGKFLLANGGTIFLDEIGDMPLSLQAKILRVLQAKVVEPVGSIKSFPVDVRIIAATNRNLEDLMNRGLFREDLFYRLNVFPLFLPPLRDRPEDISELANHFLLKHAPIHRKDIKSLAPETRNTLQAYHWPGNVRELENIIECAVIKASGDTIPKDDLPLSILTKIQTAKPVLSLVDSPEKRSIINALQIFGTSVEGKKKAANHLGVGIATLYRKLKKYGI